MSDLSIPAIKAKVTANITTNGNNEITGAQVAEILNDLADSSVNKTTNADLLGVSEYNPTRTYLQGQTCIKDGLMYQALVQTTGTFALGDWNVIVLTLANVGALINSAVAKSVPVDADMFGLMDSGSGNLLKKLSYSDLKTNLATVFVPFTGAASNVDLNAKSLINVSILSVNGDASINGVTVGLGAGSVTTNTVLGYQVLNSNTSGSLITAIGYQAAYNNTIGQRFVAIGQQSLFSAKAMSRTVSIGYQSQYYANDSASNVNTLNTAVGDESLKGSSTPANNTGTMNSVFGAQGMFNNSSGERDTAIGYQALYSNTTGSNHTAIGWQALRAGTTSTGNVGLGYMAGAYETGSNKFFVDNQDRVTEALGRTNSLLYGVFASSPSSQSLTVNGVLIASQGFTVTGTITASAIDTTATGGTDTLSIGGTNADVINIGRAGATVNILGSALYEYAANQYVLDKLITLNYGGALASGAGVGFEIEENSVITGYLKTNATRDGFSVLTPAIAYRSDVSLASLTADRVHTLPDVSGTLASRADKLSVFAATTSAELAGVISDETGTGALVFGTSPTFTTQITTPRIYGSTADNGDILIDGTSSSTKTTSYVILQSSGGGVVIGGSNSINSAFTSVAPVLNVFGTSTLPVIFKSYFNSVSGAPVISLGKSRGATVGTETATSDGDALGYISFDGVNSSNSSALAAYIEGKQDGSGGAAFIPGRLSFYTATNSVAANERVRIDSLGNVGIGTTTISARNHIVSTTEQLRVGYDASNYYSTTVDVNGKVTFDAVGTQSAFVFNDPIQAQWGSMESVYYRGFTSYSSIADNSNLNFGTGDFSLEVAFRYMAKSTAVVGYLLCKQNGSTGDGYWISISTSGVITTTIRVGGTSVISNNYALTDGNFYHYTVVFNRAGNMLVYVNGVLVSTSSLSTVTGSLSTADAFVIGSYSGLASNFVRANVNKVRVFNVALTANEAILLYNNGRPDLSELPYDLKWGTNIAYYTSDFSSGTDGWVNGTSNRFIISGNNDGVSDGTTSYDNCLKGYADSASGNHGTARSLTVLTPGKRYRVRFNIYIPSSNTNLNGFKIQDNNSGNITYFDGSTGYTGTWKSVDFIMTPGGPDTATGSAFQINSTKNSAISYVGAGSSSDDMLYITNMTITEVGAISEWNAENCVQSVWYDRGSNALNLTNNNIALSNKKGIVRDLSTNNYYARVTSAMGVDTTSLIAFIPTQTNVTASRVLDTTYTNSSSTRSIMVVATIRCSVSVAAGSAYVQGKSDSSTPPTTVASGIVGVQSGLVGEDNTYTVVFVVAPGMKYRIDSTIVNGTATLGSWWETSF